MRVHEIRMTVEAVLSELGFDGGLWAWKPRPNTLEILIGERLHSVELRSGMSRRRLNREIGRIEGWSDWTRRTQPARPLREHPKIEPGYQRDIEDLL